jgi:hypothetical protein
LPSWEEQPEEKEDHMAVKEVSRVKTDQQAENYDADSTPNSVRFLFGVRHVSELDEIGGLE